MPARIQFEKSDNISKQRMDWLGAHGNTWAPVKVMPGTCEACLYRIGEHSDSCVTLARPLALRREAREVFLDAAYDLNQRGIL